MPVDSPYAVQMTLRQKERQRALIVPREHGAWGMLLVPLVMGATIGLLGGGHWAPVVLLTIAVLALFWLRTPAGSWLGPVFHRADTPPYRTPVRPSSLPPSPLTHST